MTREIIGAPSIQFMPPDQARAHLNLDSGDKRADLGVTSINRETGESKIIINSGLSEAIQRVVLEHERVQLDIITRYVQESPRKEIAGIMRHAHDAGLRAGMELADELGVRDEYLRLRAITQQAESTTTTK